MRELNRGLWDISSGDMPPLRSSRRDMIDKNNGWVPSEPLCPVSRGTGASRQTVDPAIKGRLTSIEES
jgi:hypothetical protein